MPRARLFETDQASEKKYRYARVTRVNDLSLDLIEQFCTKVAAGVPATTCCDYFGIADKTFQLWRRLGEDYLDGGKDPRATETHAMFVCGLRMACAEWVEAKVTSVQSSREWFRDLKLLSIRDRANFSENVQGGQDDAMDPQESFL